MAETASSVAGEGEEELTPLEFEKLITDEVKLNYSDISKFEYLVSKFNIQIINKNFDEKGGIFKIQGNLTSINNLKKNYT
jgi:putative IMPACT (imprinted ancient) family translation regulator